MFKTKTKRVGGGGGVPTPGQSNSRNLPIMQTRDFNVRQKKKKKKKEEEKKSITVVHELLVRRIPLALISVTMK